VRLVLAGSAGLLLALQALRVAAVQGAGGEQLVALLWPNHPDRVIEKGLARIGAAAGQGKEPDRFTLATLAEVSQRSPLASTPFLVAGTGALAAGRERRGAALLGAALSRDPRNTAAHVLLANQAIAAGDLRSALQHIAVLARLVPEGLAPFGPALAEFAKEPTQAVQLAPLLNREPTLRDVVLHNLAADAGNAAVVLRLAGNLPPLAPDSAPPNWQARLLGSMVEAGRIADAYQLWSRFTGRAVPAGAGLIDPGFRELSLPPPFGWTLSSGAEGSAEPDGPGGLQLLYYGRSDAVLASQLTTLSTGAWRLSVRATGGGERAGDSLAWRITCAGSAAPIGRLPLTGTGARQLAVTFTVPAGCAAQRIELAGISPEFPATTALTLNGLSLTKVAR
jgi:hypothetical protein